MEPQDAGFIGAIRVAKSIGRQVKETNNHDRMGMGGFGCESS
jgi:hypothetical protein